MTSPSCNTAAPAGGITIHGNNTASQKILLSRLEKLGLDRLISLAIPKRGHLHLSLRPECAAVLAPEWNTLQVSEKLGSNGAMPNTELEREILVAMLAAPYPLEFPNHREFESAVRIRENIVRAAECTQLAFDTDAIERPEDCWRYTEASGFTLRPGSPLIDSLIKATQPDRSGRRYAFSCYRATEYVILLGIAQELVSANPAMLAQLQQRWERKAIMSGAFHEAFLVERGSLDNPVPTCYYVPGDRVWFRNPDERSSDISGYEGSWVIYIGRGLFCNFWKAKAPYTLRHKCLEVFHWRHGATTNADGELFMDETAVENRVARSLAAPEAVDAIVECMMQFRAPQGIYETGGCIDASREYPRFVHPETSDIHLAM